MAWPTNPVAVGEVITAAQMNGLPVRIADVTLSASAATIDFSSIPSQFAHLYFALYARGDAAAISTPVAVRYNNDSAANYDAQYVQGVAAAAGAGEAFAGTSAQVGNMPANTAGANLFSALSHTVEHYANSANNKSAESAWAIKTGTATTNLAAGVLADFWRSNAAITRVTFLPGTGNFVSGSRVTLYGLP